MREANNKPPPMQWPHTLPWKLSRQRGNAWRLLQCPRGRDDSVEPCPSAAGEGAALAASLLDLSMRPATDRHVGKGRSEHLHPQAPWQGPSLRWVFCTGTASFSKQAAHPSPGKCLILLRVLIWGRGDACASLSAPPKPTPPLSRNRSEGLLGCSSPRDPLSQRSCSLARAVQEITWVPKRGNLA